MSEITYIEAIRQALWEEMERDDRVFLIGEDIAVYGGAFKITQGFLERFGEDRVIDTPIAESAIIGSAVGAALMGLRPVVEMQFADFIACAFDQIVNMAAKFHYRTGTSVPLVIRAPSGGGVHGGPFHSQNPEGWFVHVPGLKVVAPSTPNDAKGLLKAAIRDPDPVVYFEHKYLYRRVKGKVPQEDCFVPIGKAEVKRDGTDVTLVCHSKTLSVALKAAEQLAEQDVKAEVLDLRSLRPLDEAAILESVRKTNRAVVIEEGWPHAGIGAQVVDLIQRDAFDDLDAPVQRVNQADVPMPYNKHLERAAKASPEKVVAAARRVLYLE